ncbi:hypothetical protein GCM10027429_07120 [Marivirga atlantica]|jgi:glycosyltransferase involved in cell wall biosynthesis|uniref:Glycosyltransferase family 2 protein n=1 Tax=Marivirga atlantica TaxID=1548457 RepID=A0A937AKD5_9BACT|nr:glycosyltransferase family 2 protein [Marivirga atlantica]MBL0764322.1 glycosyltransferase family 2 protein [Marivirga atlantica]
MDNKYHPLVSIVIPNYNRESLIEETLNSVLQQTINNWECIIVDDGSTDNSINLIKHFTEKDNRFKLILRDRKPKGASTCRNIGIAHSRSQYIVFLDSDDLLAPFSLQTRLSFIEKNKPLDLAVFSTIGFKEEPGDYNLVWNILNKEKNPSHLRRLLIGDTPWATLSCIWRKTFLERIGGWEEKSICWQDWELHIRALLEGAQYSCFETTPDSYYRCEHNHVSIGKNERKKEHLLSRRQTIYNLWIKYDKELKARKVRFYFMLWAFRLTIFLREIDEKYEANETWRLCEKLGFVLSMRYLLWSIYLRKEYYLEENKNTLLKKILDKVFYNLLKPHFWDTKNTFKKIIV